MFFFFTKTRERVKLAEQESAEKLKALEQVILFMLIEIIVSSLLTKFNNI